MSIARTGRRSRVAAALGAGLLAATLSAALQPAAAQAVALTGTITVTSPTSAKLAADTAKQVIVLTVAGAGVPALSEDNVASIGLGVTATPDACDALTTYVVTSPTVVTVKTPTTGTPPGCPVGTGDIVINFVGGDTLTRTNGITFVAPPSLAALAAKPIINENSSGLAVANQQQRFLSSGGQVVRVKSGAGFAFDPRTVAALGVTLGGKAGTEVKVYRGTDNTLLTAANATDAILTTEATAGNYLTFRTTAAMDPANDVVSVAQNGVSKSFLKAETGAEVATGPAITSMSVNSGKATGGTVVALTGTNFNKDVTKYNGTDIRVMFCGVEADDYGTTSPVVPAVNTAGTVITVVTPDVTNVATGVGTGTYAGTCPVTIIEGTWTSPLNGNTAFSFLSE